MRFFIHNSWHCGDIILTRPFICAVKERFPDVEIILETTPGGVYLWGDLGLPVIPGGVIAHHYNAPTPNCPPDAIFLNMWFGVYWENINRYGLTYQNNVDTFNRHMTQYNLQHHFQLDFPTRAPAINFNNPPAIPFAILENSILVENGPAFSLQSNFPMNDHLAQICDAFPQFNFCCAAPLPCAKSNLIDCSSLNLIQLSEVSKRCKALLTVGSGVNAATYTEENRYKPRCLAGFIQSYKMWDESNTVIAGGLPEVFGFLGRVANG